MSNYSRREFLSIAAATGAAAIVPSVGLASPAHIASGAETRTPLNPFPLSSVRLSAGIFREEAEINARYLDSLPVDRLLHSFRLTAGLSSTAVPYKGWEDPTCELRGHFAGGHFLSAVALASATSGNDVLKSRGDQLVAGLAQCQKKMGTGYLSAFPSALFDHLVDGKNVWAPFYTYHKIMAGLLDMYILTGNTDALEICEGMAKWAGSDFWGIGVISAEQRQRMLRTEFGGMNEVLVNLAAVTKKDRYLEAARLFEQPSFLDPLAARRDELQGLHANTHVPKIIGAARTYEVTGDQRYKRIAEYFLDEVLSARCYAIGNTSVDEHWRQPAGHLEGTLAWANAECCVAYNLMKLERIVFGWTGETRWMDAYERALLNCRLGTQNADGLKQYFFPLAAGYWRAYNSPEDSFWCCTGTGVEEFAKFTDTIYFHRNADVYVNQFIASTLDWKDEGIGIEQITKFPTEQGTALKIRCAKPHERTIHVRIPGWATGATVKINGRNIEAVADPGSYLAVRRIWQDGDTLSVGLPMGLWQEALPGDASVTAVLYGPVLLAASLGAGPANGPTKVINSGSTIPKDLPKADKLPEVKAPEGKDTIKPEDWVQVDSAANLRFKATAATGTLDVTAMYKIRDERYSVYWQTTNPKEQS